MADNEVNAKLTADTEEARKNVDKLGDSFDEAAESAEDASKEAESFGDRMSKIGGKLTGVGTALSVGVTAPILGIAGAAVQMGLEAVEAESLFDTSFGNMADAARQWSMETSDALGLNEFELRRQSATMFTMVESMGIGRQAAFDMATGITTLAGDMASFFNMNPDEAFNKLRAGITGEAEPLKALGILVTENMIKQTDFAQAILATGRQMTEQEKVMARYHAIMEQTSTAQGDLARTAESPANRIRRMGESIKEAGTKLGLALIPAVERVLPLLEKGVQVIERVVQKFSELPGGVQDTIIVLVGLVAAAGPALVIAGQLVTAWGSVAGAMGAAAPKIASAASSLSTAAPAIGGFAKSLPGMVTGLGGLAKGATLAGAGVVGLKIAAAGLVGVGIGKMMNEAAIATRGYRDAADETIEKVGLFKVGLSLIPDILGGIVARGKDFLGWLVELPGRIFDWVSSLDIVQGSIAAVQGALEMLGPVGDAVVWAFNAIGDAATFVWDKIKEAFGAIGPLIVGVQEKIQSLGEWLFKAAPAMEPFKNATEEQMKAFEAFKKEQDAATKAWREGQGALQDLTKAEKDAGAATKMSAEEAKKAAAAREREAKVTKSLADALGTSGLVNAMNQTNRGLEELNRRGEELSSQGLDKVIKQVAKLKAEGVPLTGALKAWDDQVKANAANLTPLADVIKTMPLPELSDDINELAGDMDFGSSSADAFNDSLIDNSDSLTAAQRAAMGMPPAIVNVGDAMDTFGGQIENVSHLLTTLGMDGDSVVGSLLGSFTSLTSGLSGIFKAGGGGGGLGGLFSGLKNIFAEGGKGLTGGFMKTIGGIANLAGPIAAIAGPAISGIGKLIGGLFKSEAEKIAKDVERDFGVEISEGLSKAIEQTAKDFGTGRREATLLNLSDIIGEAGGIEEAGGIQKISKDINELLDMVAMGTVPAEEGLKEVGKSFGLMADAALEAGGIVDAGMLEIIQRTKGLGDEVPEVAAFIKDQLSQAAEGIGKVIGGIQLVDKQDAQDQATIFAGAFFATLEQEGLLAAVDAFQPAFEKLKETIADAGIEGVDFGGVERLFEIAGKEEFRPLIEGVEGLNDALVGMANSGYLTADSFSAFQRQGQSAFEQLQAAGLSQQESLQQIAPFLQSAIDAAERFGIPLDENTQSLIAQAEAAGIAFETDPMNKMADALVVIAELLGATDEQLAGLGETATATGEQMSGAFGEGVAEPMVEGVGKISEGLQKIHGDIEILPDTAGEAVTGIQDAFASGSEGIVEGLAPISDAMANEIREAGEDTSSAIDASFKSTNEAIKSGLGEVSQTFELQVVPAANAAASATDKIAASARAAAEAARSIEFPEGPRGGEGGDIQAAAGFRGVLGRDTLIQAHRGEFVNILSPADTRAMDFRHAQNGMGPRVSRELVGGETRIEGDEINITFVASGNRQQDESTLEKLLKELDERDGAKRRELQNMLGVRT